MKLTHLRTLISLANNNCDFGIHSVLGMSRSTMWSHITEIENEVGFKLVNRRKQNTTFTDDGEMFIPYAEKIYSTFEDSIAKMNTKKGKGIPGELIISCTRAVAEGWLLPGMREFSKQYPEININIVGEDRLSKTLINSADIFLRPIGDLESINKKWSISYTHGLFASQGYLDKMGTPKDPQDLVKHRIIAYGEQEFSYFEDVNWHLKGKGYGLPRLTPSLSINSTRAIYTAALEDLGICSSIVDASSYYKKRLINILPQIIGPTIKSSFCTRDDAGIQKQNNIDLLQSYMEQYISTLGVNIEYE